MSCNGLLRYSFYFSYCIRLYFIVRIVCSSSSSSSLAMCSMRLCLGNERLIVGGDRWMMSEFSTCHLVIFDLLILFGCFVSLPSVGDLEELI
jgi:hypothetical protein